HRRPLPPGLPPPTPPAPPHPPTPRPLHCAVIAAESVEQLEENVRAASAFEVLEANALAEIEQRTAGAWEDNTFFRAWT
ncbi:MAG: aldo/keto reductase, partial [Cyanobacteria bacterium P01_G01_bin.38]